MIKKVVFNIFKPAGVLIKNTFIKIVIENKSSIKTSLTSILTDASFFSKVKQIRNLLLPNFDQILFSD